MEPKSKHVYVLIVILVVSVLVMGCNGRNSLDQDRLDAMINSLVIDTNEAIERKDIKKARDVWSRVTELSIQTRNLEDISDSLEKLSTNYVKLITYLETNEEYLLEDFKKEFNLTLEILKGHVHELTESKKK